VGKWRQGVYRLPRILSGSLSGDSAEAVHLQSDGRLIVAGTATPERYRFDFAVARYFRRSSRQRRPRPSAPSRGSCITASRFDIDLPLNGRGIECRAGDHQVIFVFNEPVTVGSVAVQGSGNVNRYTASGSKSRSTSAVPRMARR
jgi:hypothetical protein